VLPVSWLAEEAGLPDPCYHENLEYLFEIMQVKVPESVSYLPSWSYLAKCFYVPIEITMWFCPLYHIG
jgi:hypothetical protein